MVSHVRYILDRTVRRIFAFHEDGKLTQHEGGYTDYVNSKIEEIQEIYPEKDLKINKDNWKEGHKKKLKFSYEEQKEYQTIESDIQTIEVRIEEIDSLMPKFASDFIKLNEFTKEKEGLEIELEIKMDRWMYLEDLAQRIEAGEE